jgi:hypothetical protein
MYKTLKGNNLANLKAPTVQGYFKRCVDLEKIAKDHQDRYMNSDIPLFLTINQDTLDASNDNTETFFNLLKI